MKKHLQIRKETSILIARQAAYAIQMYLRGKPALERAVRYLIVRTREYRMRENIWLKNFR